MPCQAVYSLSGRPTDVRSPSNSGGKRTSPEVAEGPILLKKSRVEGAENLFEERRLLWSPWVARANPLRALCADPSAHDGAPAFVANDRAYGASKNQIESTIGLFQQNRPEAEVNLLFWPHGKWCILRPTAKGTCRSSVV